MARSFQEIEANTRAVYDQHAAAFDRQRFKGLFEREWLMRFAGLLPAGGSVLDVGCGAGDPIARYFIEKNYELVGADFSVAMLALARERFPEQVWHEADMRSLDLGRRYDGIVAWDSFFHLTPDDQRTSLARMAAHLRPGGAILLTVGPEAGEVVGAVEGEPVYHSSLAPEQYRAELALLGIRVVLFVPEDPGCDFHSVLLAQADAD